MSADAASRLAARTAVDIFARRHRLHWAEALPWIVAVAAYFVFPDYLALGAQVLATILFALSLDLILGYAGIVTLGPRRRVRHRRLCRRAFGGAWLGRAGERAYHRRGRRGGRRVPFAARSCSARAG